MKENPYPGKLVVFEGLDGSGQTTQAKLLEVFLKKNGFKVILTKEPTLESEAGFQIRRILDKKEKASAQELQRLFSQDRAEHLENKIIPALKEGKIVISDRYFFSSFAFGSLGTDLEWLIKINQEFIFPDMTIILKVSPEVCLERIKKRGIPQELFEELEKLRKVWQTYATFPKRFTNVYLIDGEQPKEEVFENVKRVLKTHNFLTIRRKNNGSAAF